jgi:EAL domain-containing protein (putative c-di-GMP-specific phosphodiesterase class I)
MVKQPAQRYLAFAFASADLLFEIDAAGVIGFAMGATTGLTALKDAELVGRNWGELVLDGDKPLLQRLIAELKPGTRCGPILVALALPGREGGARRGTFCAFRMPDSDGHVACTLTQAAFATVSQAIEKRRDAESQALAKDDFTAAANDLIQRQGAVGGKLALTLIDLPELDGLQTALPKPDISLIMRNIGATLRQASADGATVGRLGDHRFGVVRDQRRDIGDLTAKLESVAESIRLHPAMTELALSDGALNGDQMKRAMRYVIDRYSAMEDGGGLPESLAGAFDELVSGTIAKMAGFIAAVRDQSFEVAYQPIVGLADGVTHHFEVLARFEGSQSPFETIRFAEELGIIERFDLAVATRAIDRLLGEFAGKPIALAVNVSARSIENTVFQRCLLELLAERQEIAARLSLEITESAQLRDLAAVDAVLQRIRALGYAVCIDDLGAGAASFQYLQRLTVDYAKIDGDYIKRLGQTLRDDAMLKGIVRLCDDLGVKVIAEMVENQIQAEALAALGVQYGQGWFYGKPMPQPVIRQAKKLVVATPAR